MVTRNDSALEDAKSLKRSAESNVRDAAGHVRNIGENVQDNIRNFAYEAGQRMSDYVSAGRERFSSAADDLTDTVRERPLQSSLVALGIGLVLGMFFSRR